MLQKASILEYFEFYLSNEDVKHGKPDPEIYNKAIDKLRVRPEECLILEDNENGIRAAKASGANLLVISGTDDLNIDNISMRINEIGSGV
jgi:HAD superfamily hydrolase (TIGR01509 family)